MRLTRSKQGLRTAHAGEEKEDKEEKVEEKEEKVYVCACVCQ